MRNRMSALLALVLIVLVGAGDIGRGLSGDLYGVFGTSASDSCGTITSGSADAVDGSAPHHTSINIRVPGFPRSGAKLSADTATPPLVCIKPEAPVSIVAERPGGDVVVTSAAPTSLHIVPRPRDEEARLSGVDRDTRTAFLQVYRL